MSRIMKNEIVIYQPDDLATRIDVRIEDETNWLNRHQIADLFGRDIKTIGKHINNALKEELQGFSVVAKFATTAQHGAIKRKMQTKNLEYYSLDDFLLEAERVKSKQDTQFRIWAGKTPKEVRLI